MHRASINTQQKPPLPPIPSADVHKPSPPQKPSLPPIPPARPLPGASSGPAPTYYKALFNFNAEYPEELSLEVSV